MTVVLRFEGLKDQKEKTKLTQGENDPLTAHILTNLYRAPHLDPSKFNTKSEKKTQKTTQ